MSKREMTVSVIGVFASTLLATFFSETVLSAEGTHIILASTGATAITAVIGGESVHHLSYAFMIVPVFFNAIIVLSIANSLATFRDKNPYL
jgi:CBS domain-containing membrane protein